MHQLKAALRYSSSRWPQVVARAPAGAPLHLAAQVARWQGRKRRIQMKPWEQQHQGQATGRFRFPILQIAIQRLLHEDRKALAHALIKAVVAAKPLPGSALLEPELQNLLGAQDEQL